MGQCITTHRVTNTEEIKQSIIRMTDSVSFKVVLKEQNELRRFVVDKEVSSSISYLQEKLCLVFPQLKQKIFTISWTDEDGDIVTIATDEELIIALTEMQGPVYKLTVDIKSEKKTEDNSSKTSHIHLGIVCDACEKTPIVGHRYKCVVCDDFDLCGSCETAGCHPVHNMIRISNQEMNFPQRLFKRIHKMQERAEKRNSRQEKNSEPSVGGCGPRPPFNSLRGRHEFNGFPEIRGGFGGMGGMRGGCIGMGGMRGGFGGFGGMKGGCGARAWAGPAFEAMMKGWMGEEKKEKEENEQNKENKEEKQSWNVEKEGTSSEQEDINEASKQFAAMKGSAEYLKNVGDFVEAALDPFGIDVQVCVETPESGLDLGSQGCSSTADDKSKGEKSCDQNDNESSEQDEGEWTVVAEKDVENGIITSENPSKNNLYQSLEKDLNLVDAATTAVPSVAPEYPPPTSTASTATGPTPSAPIVEATSTPAAVSHPDPKIQVAVQAMMNMGFTNEGGWLSSLLEAKNGDIGKVLDILQTGTRRMY